MLSLAVVCRLWFLTALLLGCGITSAEGANVSDAPRIMLWAWERPETLAFLNPKEVGVAYLAGKITLRGAHTILSPRTQVLEIPASTYLEAVVRIEAQDPTILPEIHPDELAKTVVGLCSKPGVRAVQIDFDARLSQREFYRQLLNCLKRRLPPQIGLSMTALASWCLYDYWMSGLDVNEIVPMFFSMGADHDRIVSHLKNNRPLAGGLCRCSLGISAETGDILSALEETHRINEFRRIYLFQRRPWSAASFAAFRQRLKDGEK